MPPEPARLQRWAWVRACKRADIDPDGPMTMNTKRALIVLADTIQQHEEPPLTMADVIRKAIETGAGEAYQSNGRLWPGTNWIGQNVLERMKAEDDRIAEFLTQALHDE